MIARLPEMHKQIREMAAGLALLASGTTPTAGPEDDPTGF